MKKIKTKILFNHINNQKILFSHQELKKVELFFTGEKNDQTEKRALLSLIINTKNNVLNEKLEFWKDFISFNLKDVNRNFKTKNPLLNIANILNKTTIKIDDAQLSFEQEKAYNALLNRKNKVVHISAGTGSGKTWLSWLAIKKNAENAEKFTALHITINESLEEQLITKYRNNKEGISIGNKITKANKQYIIGTQEKIFAILGQMIENGIFPEIVVVDEAHFAENKSLRGKFYRFVVNRLNDEFNPRFWLLSPFLKNSNAIFNKQQNQCKKIKINSFKSNKMFLKTKGDNTTSLEKDGQDISLETKYKNTIGMTLNYFSSKENIYNSSINEPEKINMEQKAQIITFIKNQPLSWKFEDYYAVNLLKKGIGIYHSSMPQKVKTWLFELEKDNLITTIFATHAIANGIDFSFDNIKMHTLKSGKQGRSIMDVNLFNNLTGRSGRYNLIDGLFKKSLITFVEPNNKEEKWIGDNRDLFYDFQREISHEKKDRIIDGNLKQFQLFKDSEFWKASLFLIDPRIDYRITKNILENKEKIIELNTSLSKIFQYIIFNEGQFPGIYSEEIDEKTGFSNIKEEIVSLFSNINAFYSIQKENSINEENPYKYKKIFGNTLKSFYYLNEDEVYSGWWYAMKKKTKEEISSYGWFESNATDALWKATLNNKFEMFINMYRKEIKFKMSTMINHAISLNNELAKIHNIVKFVTLNDIKKYKIIDVSLLKHLRMNNLLEEIARIISDSDLSGTFNKKIITVHNYERIFDNIKLKLKNKKNKTQKTNIEIVNKIQNTIKEFYEKITKIQLKSTI